MKNKIVVNNCFEDKEGKRFLPIKKSGIPTLFIFTDRIPLVHFGGDPKIYIAIEEILKWFKEEIKESQGKNKEIIKRNIIFLKNLNNKEVKNGK